jgi:CTP synthase
MEIGIQPQILICRSEHPIDEDVRRKIALFTNVDPRGVVEALDADSIYQVPLEYRRQGLDDYVLELLGLEAPAPDMTAWSEMVDRARAPSRGTVRIAVVGKYTELVDAYKSVQEGLLHGGIAHDVSMDIDWISSEEFEEGSDLAMRLGPYHGLLVPGGFGARGVEGMLKAIQWARTAQRPFFGICLGLQCAVIEHARNVCGLAGANSLEFDPDTPHPVIALMDAQHQVIDKGGTMRLGAYPARLAPGSKVHAIYGVDEISERHRHRYEVNNRYQAALSQGGLHFSGMSPDRQLVEMVERPSHPWFVGCQFHPELKSRPNRAHPLFASFVEAAAREAGIADAVQTAEVS